MPIDARHRQQRRKNYLVLLLLLVLIVGLYVLSMSKFIS